MSDKLTCSLRHGFACRNLPHLSCRATPARRFERLKGGASTLAPALFTRHHPYMGCETAMLRAPRLASALYLFAVLAPLCVLANLSVEAKPAKDRSVVVPTSKPGPARTDLTPRNRNDCLAVAQTLNEQAKRLSQQAKQEDSRESSLAWHQTWINPAARGTSKRHGISIEWMNGCLNNFVKDAELGFCSKNEGYACALNPGSDGCVQRR